MPTSLPPLRVVLALTATFVIAALAAAGTQAQTLGSTGGSFELTDQTGKPFSSKTLVGRPYAIFFGFTHCPDVCPTTLVEISNRLAALGAEADQLRVVFVSVDFERDTPDALRAYLSSFDARIIGLSGSEAQLAEAAKGWNAHYDKFIESNGSITIVHTAHVYLMGADNRLMATLNFQEPESEQLAKLKRLLAGKPAN
ncbi:MAG TPA: SCO family protein [Hyphomicrobiaceae bacterium]|nr:SCO family protein [Hyphomicrobiaceae bacterium]